MKLGKERILVIADNLVSGTASTLLNIALAGYIHKQTQSAVAAAAILIMAYLPPLLLGPRLGGWIDQRLSRKLLISFEVLAALTSAASSYFLAEHAPTFLVLGFMACRAIAWSVVRTSLTKWLKLVTPPAQQMKTMQVFQFGLTIAFTLAGIGTAIASRFSEHFVAVVTAIDLSLYASSIAIQFSLPKKPLKGAVPSIPPSIGMTPSQPNVGHLATYREIFATPQLGAYFMAVCFGQGLFQAAMQIIVSVLGSMSSGEGVSVATLQMGSGVGLMLGMLTVWYLPKILDGQGRMVTVFGLGITFLLLATQTSNKFVTLVSFLMMVTIFELIDLYSYSRFFLLSPLQSTARYGLALRTLSGALMSLAVLVYAVLIDSFGFSMGSVAYATGGAGAILLLIKAKYVLSSSNTLVASTHQGHDSILR